MAPGSVCQHEWPLVWVIGQYGGGLVAAGYEAAIGLAKYVGIRYIGSHRRQPNIQAVRRVKSIVRLYSCTIQHIEVQFSFFESEGGT
jgi:hypothetical protein